MAYQQGPPQPEYWTQNQAAANTHPNTPVLSFRTFHATHFSWSQRQAFFGGAAPSPSPTPTPPHYHPSWPYNHPTSVPPPVETDTLANPPESTWDQYQDLAHPHLEQAYTVNNDKATTTASVAAKDEVPGSESDLDRFGLTQEAIEIFEFSRRFREEKRAALAEERARMVRRRTKRRRLTRRGFAPDEGNSGSDEPEDHLSDAADNSNNKADDLDKNGGGSSGSEDEDREGNEDEDEFVVQTEPPATDVAFLTQPSRQRDRTRQKLYGLKTSNNQDKDVLSRSDEMWSIRMLEAMLNQTFIDSLGPETPVVAPAKSTAATGGQNHQRRSRDSGKGARSQQQSQVVYWPGMPMRC
ncbi:hypothetical protein F5H01DRAFT_361379 [Linnemannia elongata]|nr:hypothetical protein F5H01DRAFT_361379 [Linnemannia elongata]